MYKVLLVDDERLILEGISNVVDWAEAGTVLIGTARNGLEAFEKMRKDPPDIIISDIKMPGMDGLQLAEKVSAHYPAIKFVLLSGFSEFEYARSAIQYGVKHYLVKPCNENKILAILKELATELKQEEQRDEFISNMRYGLEKVLPHVKEQFLKEFVTNKTYGNRDWEYYRKLFELDLEDRKVRLILFELEGSFEFEHMFAVKNIAEDLLKKTVLSSTVGEHVLIVVEDIGDVNEMYACIHQIRDTFLRYYKIDLTIALSEADDITRARLLYRQTLECLNYRFYLGEGTLITRRDIADVDYRDNGELVFDEDNLMVQIKTGNWKEAQKEIDLFFQKVSRLRSSISTAKSYVIQQFISIIRLGGDDALTQYREKLVALMDLEKLQSIQALFNEIAHQITAGHYEETTNKHSAIIHKVLTIIEEHLGNPELSLNWVAHQMLYMNSDYLGKLFKKETGEKFSNYVMKTRISKATELLVQRADIKIFELAERLGFGDNSQYFSQVFKKYAGCTPSEYMKMN
jgi:two-component system response regulator YesN